MTQMRSANHAKT